MKPLWLHGVTGLYQELFQPDTRAILCQAGGIENSVLDSGVIFWRQLFRRDSLDRLTGLLEDNIHNPAYQTAPFLGILADKDLFIEKVLESRIAICDQRIEPQKFFSTVEILTILCELYSKLDYYPFRLTLQDGFLLNEISSIELIRNCLNKSSNPYLSFIKEVIIPIICEYVPDIIFCTGKITYFNVAIAIIVKRILPKIHICITRHASEYYALNKIIPYLENNDILFTAIDSIVLEYFDETESSLLHALVDGQDLDSVPNIIVKDKFGTIKLTSHKVPEKHRGIYLQGRVEQTPDLAVSPVKIFDVHLEPYVKCFWNQCSFCGINKKYSHGTPPEDSTLFVKKLESLCKHVPDGSYLWFIDEAIQAGKLWNIARYLLEQGRNYIWQARSRIDSALLKEGLAEALAKSGLKELRLGLESGSIRILHLMNKFDEGFSLDLVEEVVKKYTANGISIHFPIMIGFPGEGKGDRQKTYELLTYLQEKYSTVTFNINIFNLDVSSPIFKHWDRFAISNIGLPCSPASFIGNVASWDDSSKAKNSVLERERNAFMREKLYPWMPMDAMVKPTIVYRLSETIRNTLIWKFKYPLLTEEELSLDITLQTNTALRIIQKNDGSYLAYNWDSHHFVEGNNALLPIFEAWNEPRTIKQGVEILEQINPNVYKRKDLGILIKKLVLYGHILKTSKDNSTNDHVKAMYDMQYFFQAYPRKIIPDRLLYEKRDVFRRGRALEIGVGSGKNIPILRSMGFSIHGIDFSQEAIKQLSRTFPGTDCLFEQKDLRQVTLERDGYSLVVCSLVLSHLDDTVQLGLAKEIAQALCAGGCVMIHDFTENDPLYEERNPFKRRNLFTREKLLSLFPDFEILELTSTRILDELRSEYNGYFDLWQYLGRKQFNLEERT